MFTEKKQNFFNSELEHQIKICYHTIKLHCRVFCSKFMCESKHPPLALHFISTPPHFKDLLMIFPSRSFYHDPPPPTLEKFRKMSTPPANSNPPPTIKHKRVTP